MTKISTPTVHVAPTIVQISQADLRSIEKRIDDLALENIQRIQECKDLSGELDYQRQAMTTAYERIEELEEIVNEELG